MIKFDFKRKQTYIKGWYRLVYIRLPLILVLLYLEDSDHPEIRRWKWSIDPIYFTIQNYWLAFYDHLVQKVRDVKKIEVAPMKRPQISLPQMPSFRRIRIFMYYFIWPISSQINRLFYFFLKNIYRFPIYYLQYPLQYLVVNLTLDGLILIKRFTNQLDIKAFFHLFKVHKIFNESVDKFYFIFLEFLDHPSEKKVIEYYHALFTRLFQVICSFQRFHYTSLLIPLKFSLFLLLSIVRIIDVFVHFFAAHLYFFGSLFFFFSFTFVKVVIETFSLIFIVIPRFVFFVVVEILDCLECIFYYKMIQNDSIRKIAVWILDFIPFLFFSILSTLYTALHTFYSYFYLYWIIYFATDLFENSTREVTPDFVSYVGIYEDEIEDDDEEALYDEETLPEHIEEEEDDLDEECWEVLYDEELEWYMITRIDHAAQEDLQDEWMWEEYGLDEFWASEDGDACDAEFSYVDFEMENGDFVYATSFDEERVRKYEAGDYLLNHWRVNLLLFTPIFFLLEFHYRDLEANFLAWFVQKKISFYEKLLTFHEIKKVYQFYRILRTILNIFLILFFLYVWLDYYFTDKIFQYSLDFLPANGVIIIWTLTVFLYGSIFLLTPKEPIHIICYENELSDQNPDGIEWSEWNYQYDFWWCLLTVPFFTMLTFFNKLEDTLDANDRPVLWQNRELWGSNLTYEVPLEGYGVDSFQLSYYIAEYFWLTFIAHPLKEQIFDRIDFLWDYCSLIEKENEIFATMIQHDPTGLFEKFLFSWSYMQYYYAFPITD